MPEKRLQRTREVYKKDICVLECDSPSYPPVYNEYLQCGCKKCLSSICILCKCTVINLDEHNEFRHNHT